MKDSFSQENSVDSITTILLVEDQAHVRQWIHQELEMRGYNLLEACDGADALVIAELHRGPIDVLVTDVVMPNVNGPQLVKALLELRPNVKVLYISGFPEPFLRESGELSNDVNYLAKPFPAIAL